MFFLLVRVLYDYFVFIMTFKKKSSSLVKQISVSPCLVWFGARSKTIDIEPSNKNWEIR